MRVDWWGKNVGIRTIGWIPVALVVVYIHARSGAWVMRPARAENALVFVLPQHSGRIEPFRNSDDDFVLLRESSKKTRRDEMGECEFGPRRTVDMV